MPATVAMSARRSEGRVVPRSEALRIAHIYAFIALDPADNTEGLPAYWSPSLGAHLPMIGADLEMIDMLRPKAKQIATELGVPIRLVRFSVREELEVFEP